MTKKEFVDLVIAYEEEGGLYSPARFKRFITNLVKHTDVSKLDDTILGIKDYIDEKRNLRQMGE